MSVNIILQIDFVRLSVCCFMSKQCEIN